MHYLELNLMLKFSYFYTNIYTETFAISPASLMTRTDGGNAAAGLPSSWRRWSEAAFDWVLASFWAKCHQRVKVWNF